MSFFLCSHFIEREEGVKAKPFGRLRRPLTPSSLSDIEAANGKTTEFETYTQITALVGTRSYKPLAIHSDADLKMERIPNKKGSLKFRYQRIEYLVTRFL